MLCSGSETHNFRIRESRRRRETQSRDASTGRIEQQEPIGCEEGRQATPEGTHCGV